MEAKLKNALEAVEILRSVGGTEALGFAHSINLDGDEGTDAAKTEEGSSNDESSSRREWKVRVHVHVDVVAGMHSAVTW